MTQATIFVHDQAGNPIPGASIRIVDYIDVDGGVTDSNGYYVSIDLPFPTTFTNSDQYQIMADYYTATSGASTIWYGDTGVIDMMLPLSILMNYDITVIAYQGGTTDPAPGHYTGQGVITVTAIPNSGYVFDHWNMNGAFLTSSPSFHTGATGTFEAYFTVSAPPPPPPPVTPNGEITAIRVQNVTQQIWFNWDIGVGWNNEPVGNPGDAWYIAAYVTNRGVAGNLTLIIMQNISGQQEFTRKTENVAAGGAFGAEWGIGGGFTLTATVAIRVTVSP